MKRILLSIVVVGLVVGVAFYFFKSCQANGNGLQDTPIKIEDVKPEGKFIVLSAFVEGYAIDSLYEKNFYTNTKNTILGFFSANQSPGKKHFRLLRKNVDARFYVDLENLKVSINKDKKVATIDEPVIESKYGINPVDAKPYYSDDDGFWDKKKPGRGKDLEEKILEKVKAQFESPENRNEAIVRAKEQIKNLYEALGLKVEFRNASEIDSDNQDEYDDTTDEPSI